MRYHLLDTAQGRVTVSREDLATHMHVIGSTGTGKSWLLTHLARQIMLDPESPCLIVIDPHGSLYEELLAYAVYQNLPERLLLFDPRESERIVGYNPLSQRICEPSYRAMLMVEAYNKVWKEDFAQTPRLLRWLFNAYFSAIQAGLTMEEAAYLVDPSPQFDPYRQAVLPQLANQFTRADWEWFLRQREAKREEKVESTINRFRLFLSEYQIRNILTQQRTSLALNEIMDQGQILLVNLQSHRGGTLTAAHTALLGTMLVSEIVAAAFSRPLGSRPVFLICDEFQQFVTKDMSLILDAGRKFGLHLILAHQHLHQLLLRDPDVYYSAMGSARIKVIFGGQLYESAELIAKQVARFDPDQIKLEIMRTYYRPEEQRRLIQTTAEGEVTNEAVMESVQSGAIYGPASSFWDADLRATTQGSGSSTGTSYGTTRMESTSEVPFYSLHEQQELASVQFRRLEEQLYQAVVKMIDQPQQYAAVKIPGRQLKYGRVPDLRSAGKIIRDKRLSQAKEQVFTQTGYYSTLEEIEEERRARQQALLARVPEAEPDASEEELDDSRY